MVAHQDAFSKARSEWIQQGRGRAAAARISGGMLRVRGTRAGYSYAVTSSRVSDGRLDHLEGTRFEIDISTPSERAANGSVALLCRVDPERPRTTGYEFRVWPDGRYRIGVVTSEGVSTLATRFTDFLETLERRLTVECSGQSLVLSVNGVPVGAAIDGTYSDGALGLRVFGATTDFTVAFDNLMIIDLGS